MSTLMVGYNIDDKGVDDVVTAIEVAFAAVSEQRPDGIRWSATHRRYNPATAARSV
jgi:hypothetical protein